MSIQQGNFVEVRGRQWLVEAINDAQPDLTTVKLSCIADDTQGEQIEVLWDAEIGASVLEEDAWSHVGRAAPDSPKVRIRSDICKPSGATYAGLGYNRLLPSFENQLS